MEQVADAGGGKPPGGRVLFDLAFEPDLKNSSSWAMTSSAKR
jgi:hypothetical protein